MIDSSLSSRYTEKHIAQKTRWLPAELALAALCLALKEIDVFAVHRDVIVFTDNTQLLHLDNWSPISQRQPRMIHYLSQFRLTVKFVQGCKNLCADMLSRCFVDMSETDRKQFLPTAAEQAEDFILPVTVTPSDEKGPYLLLIPVTTLMVMI